MPPPAVDSLIEVGWCHALSLCEARMAGQRRSQVSRTELSSNLNEEAMSRVEHLGRQVSALDIAELQAFRDWFVRYDADLKLRSAATGEN